MVGRYTPIENFWGHVPPQPCGCSPLGYVSRRMIPEGGMVMTIEVISWMKSPFLGDEDFGLGDVYYFICIHVRIWETYILYRVYCCDMYML